MSCKPVFYGGGEIAKGGRGRGARSLAGEGEIASEFAPGGGGEITGGEIAVTPVRGGTDLGLENSLFLSLGF